MKVGEIFKFEELGDAQELAVDGKEYGCALAFFKPPSVGPHVPRSLKWQFNQLVPQFSENPYKRTYQLCCSDPMSEMRTIGFRVVPLKGEEMLCVDTLVRGLSLDSLEDIVEECASLAEALKEEAQLRYKSCPITIFSPICYSSFEKSSANGYGFMNRVSRGEHLADAWENFVRDIYVHGIDIPTGRKERMRGRRISLLHGIVVAEDPYTPPYFSSDSGIDFDWAEDYAQGIISGEKYPGEPYSYGERIKDQLLKTIESRWEVERPLEISVEREGDIKLEEPPCWRKLILLPLENSLLLMAYFRSWNAMEAAPSNLYALARLGMHIWAEREKLGREPNPSEAKLVVAYKNAGITPHYLLPKIRRSGLRFEKV